MDQKLVLRLFMSALVSKFSFIIAKKNEIVFNVERSKFLRKKEIKYFASILMH